MDNIKLASELVKAAKDLYYVNKIDEELSVQASEELVVIAKELNELLSEEK